MLKLFRSCKIAAPGSGSAARVVTRPAKTTLKTATPLLAPAGDIIAAETIAHRACTSPRPSVLSGQILKVASAFDELSEGKLTQASFAFEALSCAPAYLYDATVLDALERVLDRAGLLEPIAQADSAFSVR